MNFQDVLNLVTKGHSDNQTSKKLGVTRTAFSNWRNSRRVPDNEMLDKMAELAGIDPIEVYIAAYAERIENPVLAERFRHLEA